jgi:glyoxylase I family protein
LTHLSIGTSLIDLQSYDSPIGRKLHAGGAGLADDAPLPTLDNENGTLDHFAINVEPYDPDKVRAYLKEKGFPPFAEGERYGADGDGYSMYLRDPERNVVELKCGSPSYDKEL